MREYESTTLWRKAYSERSHGSERRLEGRMIYLYFFIGSFGLTAIGFYIYQSTKIEEMFAFSLVMFILSVISLVVFMVYLGNAETAQLYTELTGIEFTGYDLMHNRSLIDEIVLEEMR